LNSIDYHKTNQIYISVTQEIRAIRLENGVGEGDLFLNGIAPRKNIVALLSLENKY